MMWATRCAIALLLAASLVCLPAVAAPAAPDVRAYSAGQSYHRLFEDNLMPGTCGIVLERPRCLSDFETVHALRGDDANDKAMLVWLATGSVDFAVKGWNGMYTSDEWWRQDPQSAWWFDAGIISIAASMPQNDASTRVPRWVSAFLMKHVDAAPTAFQGSIAASGSIFDRVRPLQSALFASIPVTPFPNPSTIAGIKGDVQLGVYWSTLQQLMDNPLALSRPESRAFGRLVLHDFTTAGAQYGVHPPFGPLEAALVGTIPEREGMNPLRDALEHAMTPAWPIGRRQAILQGAAVTQVAYNAAVLQSAYDDRNFRGAIASIGAYPRASSQVISDIRALLKLPSVAQGGSWAAINAAGTKAVNDIISDP